MPRKHNDDHARLVAEGNLAESASAVSKDENQVRYQLVSENQRAGYTWLFLPGGPGADSEYLRDLSLMLDLPGSVYLIDLPNNGSNYVSDEYNYDEWFKLFTPTISRFKNPILVGQSFGGMFPLLFPELEGILTGFVALNSAPTIWHEEALHVAQTKKKPSFERELKAFMENQNPETFKVALMACAPYYFVDSKLEEGKKLLANLPFNYFAAGWWQTKVAEIQFNAQWIPEKVPMLILGGAEDCMCPPSLFERDKRFQRENIVSRIVNDAGHMPWIENMSAVKAAFDEFIDIQLNINLSPRNSK